MGGTCNRNTTSACRLNGPAFCADFTTDLSVLVVLYGAFAWNSRDFIDRKKVEIIILIKISLTK